MKRSFCLFSGATAIAAAGFMAAPAQAIHIDRFNDGEFDLSVDAVGQTDSIEQDGLANDSVLGGSRDAVLTFQSSDEQGVTQITAGVNPEAATSDGVPNGTLNLNSNQGEDGLLEVTYGFDGAGGSIDLVSPADVTYDGFFLNVVGTDNSAATPNATVSFTTTDTDGDSDSVDRNLADGFTGALNVPFDEFDSNVDFDSADSVVLSIEGTDSGDYAFSNFRRTVSQTAIPTPAALPAGMLMLGGMLLNRRRKKA